jgi:ribosomal protein S18 acetylase RimI-like enzyme
VIIRPATTDDAPALREIVQRAYGGYVEELGVRPRPLYDDYTERVREADAFVAEDEAGIAGLIVLERWPDHVLIDNVAVDPDRQGSGVGRALLTHAEEFARDIGVDEIRLYTNVAMTKNQSIYRHLGYREEGRQIEAGFRRVHFSKALPSRRA